MIIGNDNLPIFIAPTGLPRCTTHMTNDDLKDSQPFQVKTVSNKTNQLSSPHPLMEKPNRDPSKPLIKACGSFSSIETGAAILDQLVNKVASKTGIVKRHFIPIQAVARKTQQIIAFRPVDPMSTGLIEEGYPTKGFAIKGKSSNHGPQAGLICVDQRFSKLHITLRDDDDMRRNQIIKYNESVEECLESGDAVSVSLTLSQKRFDWLENNRVFKVEQENNESGVFTLISEGLNYKAEKKGDYFEVSYKGEPLKVLADPVTRQPLTADYDLMFIAPKAENLDLAKDDNLPVKRVHFSDVSTMYKARFKEKEGEDFTPKQFFAKEDETKGSFGQAIGNATPRIAKMIDMLNAATVGKKGNPVVHHSTDSANPYTDTNSNYPITVFMPKGFAGYDSIHIIESAEEFAEFVKQAKTHGFAVPNNPKWERKVSQARSSSFEQASQAISQLLQTRKKSST
ncbi:CyaA/EF/ExoY family adenylyl cyclase toxin [Vibrio hepatarius]|uniref:CyaA/EF/ExoY family adenylyl cyclase toxin n=1 Tax=Vibrio hepatarius TaxID=171383 RepID=UPI001C09238A|nr:CyaA/EF/ExoY family adenylyl cyclase toxin [Vibrio hepatarius]MBU2897748.1 CyaA/EF/ExoY family adenylyl cyclase toxin [Vibrio hepatarius]